MHPYQWLAPRSFWRSAIADRDVQGIDELWLPKFAIGRTDAIITAGSCFAQHMSRALVARGMHWLDAEPAPATLPPEQHQAHHYGVFSFRTGNIYTPAMLHQWLCWAFGRSPLPDELWHQDGRFFDPWRPTVEPEGYASAEHLLQARQVTLAAIRGAVAEAKLLVFTLGLTEAWENRATALLYPVCPGTLKGRFDPQAHRFRNFTFAETHGELSAVIALLREVNPRLRLLLTVSPVPLTATASGQHVLSATTYSKSVLRAVAGQLCDEHEQVDYFPSYEIISAPPFKGAFFADNQREVLPAGVALVMRHFFAALQPASQAAPTHTRAQGRHALSSEELICEDAVLDYYAKP
ncbi:MAG: GSCFA domain-containing protein [Pseudomonas sp.]|uniref:GSCFA domain-containing protein n=1 Tax=Pseudomonas sp. TaxID=306 RepID=UPI003390EA14